MAFDPQARCLMPSEGNSPFLADPDYVELVQTWRSGVVEHDQAMRAYYSRPTDWGIDQLVKERGQPPPNVKTLFRFVTNDHLVSVSSGWERSSTSIYVGRYELYTGSNVGRSPAMLDVRAWYYHYRPCGNDWADVALVRTLSCCRLFDFEHFPRDFADAGLRWPDGTMAGWNTVGDHLKAFAGRIGHGQNTSPAG